MVILPYPFCPRKPNTRSLILPIPLRAVVGEAEKLTVLHGRPATLAPRRHVVGLHLVESVDARLVRTRADGAERTIRDARLLRPFRLPDIDRLYGRLVEDTHMEKFRVLFSTEQELPDATFVLDLLIRKQFARVSRVSPRRMGSSGGVHTMRPRRVPASSNRPREIRSAPTRAPSRNMSSIR